MQAQASEDLPCRRIRRWLTEVARFLDSALFSRSRARKVQEFHLTMP